MKIASAELFVVDASVAAKWVLAGAQEPLREEAFQILNQWLEGKIQLIVPDLFWVEMTNVLWKATLRGRCSEETAVAALATLQEHPIPTISSYALLKPALKNATKHGRSVYDSVYIALAAEVKAQLITADEKLANALAAQFPIKWLGAYST